MGILGKEYFEVLVEKFVGGESKEFKIIEGELAKIIGMIKAQSKLMTNTINVSLINNSDHNRLIEKMFIQYFGLDGMSISWATSPIPNAATFCKTFIFLDNDFKETSSGRRSNKNLFIGAMIHTGLVTSSGMNEKEILAIMLHEIGHNFYNSIFHTLSSIGLNIYAAVISLVLDKLDFNKLIQKSLDDVRNFMSSTFPNLYKIYNSIKQIFYQIGTLFPSAGKIALTPILVLKVASFQFLLTYPVEKFADSFAVDHGYGAELASALNKLERSNETLGAKTVYEVPGLNWMYDLFDVQVEFLWGILGTYPSSQNRMRTGLDRLKRQLSDPDIAPAVKVEISKQIDAYEKFYYDFYLNIDTNNNKKRIFTWLFRKMVEDLFKGKMDLRELIHEIDPKKYE